VRHVNRQSHQAAYWLQVKTVCAVANTGAAVASRGGRSPRETRLVSADLYALSRSLSYSIYGCKSAQCRGAEHPVSLAHPRRPRAGLLVFAALFRRTSMKSHRSRPVFVLTLLTPLLIVYPAPAAPLKAQPAAWVAYNLGVDLHNLPTRYSCDDLELKVHDVLLALGARPDLKVLISRCESGSRSPIVRVQFAIPESVERTSKRVGMEAAVAIVRLEPGHPPSLSPADCELMRQIKDRLLAPMSRAVVSFNLACSALSSSRPSFNLSVQTLKPLDGGARVAERSN
jgi:hypothetical protein